MCKLAAGYSQAGRRRIHIADLVAVSECRPARRAHNRVLHVHLDVIVRDGLPGLFSALRRPLLNRSLNPLQVDDARLHLRLLSRPPIRWNRD
jgi:hypothetical protein